MIEYAWVALKMCQSMLGVFASSCGSYGREETVACGRRQRCLHLFVVPAFVIVVSIFFLPFEYLWQKASYQVANRKPTGGSTHTIVVGRH